LIIVQASDERLRHALNNRSRRVGHHVEGHDVDGVERADDLNRPAGLGSLSRVPHAGEQREDRKM
jgi:hypothetical protein